MQLRTRITILVVAAVVAFGAVFSAIFSYRDYELTRRYHQSILQAQKIAWTKLESELTRNVEELVKSLLGHRGWVKAWQSMDRAVISDLIRATVADKEYIRVDVYDAQRVLVYSNSTSILQDSLIEDAWIGRALNSNLFEVGLSQVSRKKYYFVAARVFGTDSIDNATGVLTVGFDLAHFLPSLAGMLDGDSFLVNLRGREVASTKPGLLDKQKLNFSMRQPMVQQLKSGDSDASQLLYVFQPLTGYDNRRVGGLLLVRDVSDADRNDQIISIFAFGSVGLLLSVLGLFVFTYLRQALLPLERSVHVLAALAQGELRTGLGEDDDQLLKDEAGQIARGVAVLRGEMLNLKMLRDERIRTRKQQERLIRQQLKLLAENLDVSSRAEILVALDSDHVDEGASGSANHDLAELAHILARMSGLVTTQQGRLVGLLKDLRAAMEHQALLVSLQQELEIAKSMQASILPRHTPLTDTVQVGAMMIPAKEIGGDFYDYFLIDQDHLALVVADVSGKGIPAAFFMAISRTLLKSNALFFQQPALVIAQLNEQLCAENEQMMFVTVFFGVLKLSTGELNYVNAGHNPPLICSPGGDVRVLPSGQNMALAVLEGVEFCQGTTTLVLGDTLVMYTDGITEATNFAGELFGEGALIDAVRENILGGRDNEMLDAILQAVRSFEAGVAQADDITCVAVRYQNDHV